MSFGYFLKAVREVILRDYAIIEEPDIDDIQYKYSEKSSVLSNLEVEYVLNGVLDKVQQLSVCNIIERLSKLRFLKARIVIDLKIF